MKKHSPSSPSPAVVRQQIVQSAIASFRIEGIHISQEQAAEVLGKIEAKLGK